MTLVRGCEIPESIPYEEALWEKKQSLVDLEVIKSGDPYTFASQYQQRPSPLGGGIFKDEFWNYYEILPPDITQVAIFGDTAQEVKKHNDYSVFQCWGKSSSGLYLIDQVRGKWEAPELERTLVEFWNKHKPTLYKPIGAQYIKIEKKSSGSSLIQSIRKDNMLPIEGIEVGKGEDKLSRVMAVHKYFSSGYIHLPQNAEWLLDYKDEFRKFMPNDTHVHDDMIDTTVHAVKELAIFGYSLYNAQSI